MNKYFMLAVMLTLAAGLTAQGKMDLASTARLRSLRCGITVSGPRSAAAIHKAAPVQDAVIHAFVTLAPGADATQIEAIDGITVQKQRGTMLMVEATADAIEQLNDSPAVSSINIERPLAAKMDRARAVSHIDEIHAGLDLPRAYTGAGVVAGLVDGGFDPNHINFQNPDGTSRISQFTYYRPTQAGGFVEEKHDAAYIPQIDTEDDDTYHGTHTLGIMAGSYRGNVSAGVRNNAFTGSVAEMPNPYYGVAYGADLAVACGALSDYYIALGVESVLDYAFSQGKPSVINLSLGSNVGPHDGSSTICRYLDAVSEQDRVVMCVSAGNEGDLPIALHKTFTDSDLSLGSFLYPAIQMTNYQNVRFGTTYFYSDSHEQFEVQAVVVNTKRNAVAMRMPLAANDGAAQYWVSSSDFQSDNSDVVSAQLARYFTGYVGLGTEFDETTGRYYGVLDCMLWDNTAGTNAAGQYVLGFIITGKAGQRVDVFNDGVYNNLSSYGLEGYSDGMTDGTISDVATGHNVVVVGSYNTRDDWASLDGNIYGYRGEFAEGKISAFTSWGTLCDGRSLPMVCAPGASIISSSNKYFIDKSNIGNESLQAKVDADGRTYAWHQSIGTSMATPLVTGSIALWLEANPDLTYKDVQQIIRETSVVDADVEASPNRVQWGAGKFNAYEGLKKALTMNSVGNVSVADSRPVVALVGNRTFAVSLPGAQGMAVEVFDIAGRRMAAARTSAGDSVELSLDGVPAGIYLFSVDGRHTSRISVK